jgi:hypothetical protein
LRAVQETPPYSPRLFAFKSLRMKARAVLEDALSRFEAEVQPRVLGVTLLQQIDDTQALQIVLEPTGIGGGSAVGLIERILTGMAEGRVAQVMGQRYRFAQILVQTEPARHRTRHLSHLERVGETRAKEVTLVVEEDLGLVDQAAKGGTVHDAVAVALEFVAVWIRRQGIATPARSFRQARTGRERSHPMHWSITLETTSSGTARVCARPGVSITT